MAIPSKIVREMIDEVIEFSRTYAVWQELMQKSNAPIRTEHPDFLLTVTNALVGGFCIGTYQLFDRDSRTKSLRRLIEDVRLSHPSVTQQLESKIAAHKTVLDKIFRLRNNVYGHRNRSQHPRDVYAAVGLTPRMMEGVVCLAQDVVSTLAVTVGVGQKDELEREFSNHKDCVLEDTRRVTHALEKDAC